MIRYGLLLVALAAGTAQAQMPPPLLEDTIEHPRSDLDVGMRVYTLRPGASDAAVESLQGHRHPGHMYVYVLEGQVRSMLDEGPAQTYGPGDAWLEKPGQLHRIINLSPDAPARLLVVNVDPASAHEQEEK